VRVFTTRVRRPKRTLAPSGEKRKRRYPHEVLVFDTETTLDPAQNLLFGVWRFYRDDPDGQPGITCIEEGIFYPDELPDTDPAGFAILAAYAAEHQAVVAAGFARPDGIPLWPLSKWSERRFLQYGYRHRNRCAIVGFNLLFDFGRLAARWTRGRGNFLGGWSLGFWGRWTGPGRWQGHPKRPRLQAKAIDPRRTLFAWGTIKDDEDEFLKGLPGQFVDLRTLSFALTDRSHTLESACKAFGVSFGKAKVEYGVITDLLVAYALEDGRATGDLYRALLDELDEHPGVDLQPHRLYSPATVGTQYLKAMGVEQPMTKFDIPNEIHGYAMCSFYGGRAEARIVRTPVPVAYVDATSMYPTVNALLDTWKLLTADRLEVVEATEQVVRLLADPDLHQRCFDPAVWREEIGVTLVEGDHPDGDLLPVRGEYDELALDPGIGLNPYRYHGTIWYALPDVINSTIHTGHPTPITRALRLVPVGIQHDLKPVPLRGGEKIDPTMEDPFVAFINLRHETKRDQRLSVATKARLDLFLKITANASGYGVLARYDRRRLSKPRQVTVYGPDEPFPTKTTTPEDPGPYCFPPLASTITAGARLLLGLLEKEVINAGGHYAFCDTDSMAIVCTRTGEPIRTQTADGRGQIEPLSPDLVVEILDRFQPLSPYDPQLIPHLWTEEHDSLDNQLWCYAISSKRYVLYRVDDQERIKVVDWSEHGLGQYLNPYGGLEDRGRDAQGRQLWIKEAWEWILRGDGKPETMPDWAQLPAVTQFSLSTPATSAWFAGYNRTQPYRNQIRPSSFGLLAHTDPLLRRKGEPMPRPAAAYNQDSGQWLNLDWYDRTTGQPVAITTASPHQPDFFKHIQDGQVRVKTLGDVLAEFKRRPEHKSLAPDGTPTTSETAGLLSRRPIESAPVLTDLIGKEGNDLEERAAGVTIDSGDYRSQYGNRGDRWTSLVLPLLRDLGAEEVMRRTGRSRSAVYEVLGGRTKGTGAPMIKYRDVAIEEAAERLRNAGTAVARHPYGVLFQALRHEELG